MVQPARVEQQARLARLVQPDPLAPAVQPVQLVLRDQLARVARPDPPAQVVQPARVEQQARLVRVVQLAQLPRQYMHNKENAVTMRLSAH